MIKSLSLFIIPVLLLTGSYAQVNQNKDIIKSLDSLITQRFANVAPGCVIFVVKKGDTLYKEPLVLQI